MAIDPAVLRPVPHLQVEERSGQGVLRVLFHLREQDTVDVVLVSPLRHADDFAREIHRHIVFQFDSKAQRLALLKAPFRCDAAAAGADVHQSTLLRKLPMVESPSQLCYTYRKSEASGNPRG